MAVDRHASVASCAWTFLLGAVLLIALGCERAKDQGDLQTGSGTSVSSDDARLNKIRDLEKELRRVTTEINELRHKMIRAKAQAQMNHTQMADMSQESQRLVDLGKKEWKIGEEIDKLGNDDSKPAEIP